MVEDDLYGDAPWMGTLRHVKQEAKVFNAIKPQFKRYPDEDAPNPYSGMQGELCQELVEKIDMQSDRSFKWHNIKFFPIAVDKTNACFLRLFLSTVVIGTFLSDSAVPFR